MKLSRVAILGLLCLLPIHAVGADEHDLSSATFIAHHPPNFAYSDGADWSELYYSQYEIDSFGEVNPTIADGEFTGMANQAVWYLLVGFCDGEDKTWAGVLFGFGEYDVNAFYITASGPDRVETLEIPTSGWPGPNQGTSVVTFGTEWHGNFEPVYYFVGYQYAGTTVIPITGYENAGRWWDAEIGSNQEPFPTWYITDEDRLGAMGIGAMGEGIDCGGTSATDPVSWGQIKLQHR